MEWRFAAEAHLHNLASSTVFLLTFDLQDRSFTAWEKHGIVLEMLDPQLQELALPVLKQLLPPKEIAAALAASLLNGRSFD